MQLYVCMYKFVAIAAYIHTYRNRVYIQRNLAAVCIHTEIVVNICAVALYCLVITIMIQKDNSVNICCCCCCCCCFIKS